MCGLVKKLRRRFLVLTIILIAVILVSLFGAIELFSNEQSLSSEFFVGVELAYGDVNDCKEMVDKVKNFTNLFVVGSLEISFNQSMLNATCDYIRDAGLSFIILFTDPTVYSYNTYIWIFEARQKYGEKFLAAYRYDEPGGRQLDEDSNRFVVSAENYTDAADTYVDLLYAHIEYYLYSAPSIVTSDYGLYWFDYDGGYDAVFAQYGWNFSRSLHIALCRGAARAHGKDWGFIITWKYNNEPYVESADELYNDLVLGYNAGAKYAIVFNYPDVTGYGILNESHFDSMRRFWTYINNNHVNHGSVVGEVAYVLPKDYGFGFRRPDDTIWGLWDADQLSKKIWGDINNLTEIYDSRLDIVYSDMNFSALKNNYDKLIYWNETITSSTTN